jgi:hypothetical protein
VPAASFAKTAGKVAVGLKQQPVRFDAPAWDVAWGKLQCAAVQVDRRAGPVMLEAAAMLLLFGAGVAVGYAWCARISYLRRQRARRSG